MSNYSLTINFTTLDELLNFTNAYNKISIKSEIKTIKTNDKRGSKTSELHKRAKEYNLIHKEKKNAYDREYSRLRYAKKKSSVNKYQ